MGQARYDNHAHNHTHTHTHSLTHNTHPLTNTHTHSHTHTHLPFDRHLHIVFDLIRCGTMCTLLALLKSITSSQWLYSNLNQLCFPTPPTQAAPQSPHRLQASIRNSHHTSTFSHSQSLSGPLHCRMGVLCSAQVWAIISGWQHT